MLRFKEKIITKKKFYAAKTPIKHWDVNVYNVAISNLIEIKSNSKSFIGYSDKAIIPLLLIMPKLDILRHLKLRMEIKIKTIKLMFFRIDDGKLLEKHKAIWTKIEDLISIEIKTLLVYDDRYINTKIRTYGNKVYTNFCDLNGPKDDAECESFTFISIDSLLLSEKKFYLQVYLDNYAS